VVYILFHSTDFLQKETLSQVFKARQMQKIWAVNFTCPYFFFLFVHLYDYSCILIRSFITSDAIINPATDGTKAVEPGTRSSPTELAGFIASSLE